MVICSIVRLLSYFNSKDGAIKSVYASQNAFLFRISIPKMVRLKEEIADYIKMQELRFQFQRWCD